MVACLLLFTRALRVRTVADLCAAAFALTVVVGLHTFRSTVQEAFPINHFLEIAVIALVDAEPVAGAPTARSSISLALVTFVVASLTLESGLLVWVVAVTAWAARHARRLDARRRGDDGAAGRLFRAAIRRAVGRHAWSHRAQLGVSLRRPRAAGAGERRFGDRLVDVLRLQRRVVGALGARVRAAERRLRHDRRLAGRIDDVRDSG